MRERQSRRQALPSFFFSGRPLFQKKRGEIIEPRKKTKTLLSIAYIWMTSYISDQLNQQQRISSFFQLLTDSHDPRVWFLGGYGISRVFFFLPCLRYASVFLAWSKKSSWNSGRTKKQQPTNQKPNMFFWKNKHKTPPQEGNCSKSQQVDTPETPWFGRILWP